jgi:putative endonuclease
VTVNHHVASSSLARGVNEMAENITAISYLGFQVMPFYVYILQSQSTGRYYCGQTNSLSDRLRQHNDPGYIETRTTKIFSGPWEVVWKKDCKSRRETMKLERAIKKRGIGRYLADKTKEIKSGC